MSGMTNWLQVAAFINFFKHEIIQDVNYCLTHIHVNRVFLKTAVWCKKKEQKTL